MTVRGTEFPVSASGGNSSLIGPSAMGRSPKIAAMLSATSDGVAETGSGRNVAARPSNVSRRDNAIIQCSSFLLQARQIGDDVVDFAGSQNRASSITLVHIDQPVDRSIGRHDRLG